MTSGGKRPGAGRKPAPNKLKQHQFRCTDDEWNLIIQAASKAGFENPSQYIRHTLKKEAAK